MENKKIKIEVYFAPQCPTKGAVEKNLLEALELESIPYDLTIEVIAPEEAEKRGFRGSPTIIINGEVFQPIDSPGFS